jgi:hypothetical protein
MRYEQCIEIDQRRKNSWRQGADLVVREDEHVEGGEIGERVHVDCSDNILCQESVVRKW